MTVFEKLAWIATAPGEVGEQARAMIGIGELALLLAKDALSGTSIALSPTKVSEVLEMTREGAAKKVQNTAVKSN